MADVLERAYIDFNTWDLDDRVWIDPRESGPSFRPGLRVIVFDEEMEVEATIEERDELNGGWKARPDWSTRRDGSFEAPPTPL